MTSRLTTFATRTFVAVSLATFSFFGLGCGGGGGHSSHLTGQFVASSTPTVPDLVKLVPQSSSGSRIVVSAVIYGPTTSTDLYSFAFDVVIGNPSVLAFVPGSVVPGPALQPAGPQTITAFAGPSGSDPTHIVVGVSKFGGGLGNGVAGSSAVIVSLSFDVIAQGTSTLSIATSPTPSVLDHNGVTIGTITFDSAGGTVAGVSTSVGPY